MIADFTVAIMAGGKSSRMGRNKALIKIGQQTILERIIVATGQLTPSETILITNTPDIYADFALPMLSDIVPDRGALGGIYTALYQSKTQYTLVIACDMPFVSADVLRLLLAQADDFDAIVPTVKGYPQGLHALYSHTCLDIIRQRIETNRLKVSDMYDDLQVKFLDEQAISQVDRSGIALMNVNTPEDLAHALFQFQI